MSAVQLPSEILRSAVREAKKKPKEGIRSVETRIGLKRWSLRGLMDDTKPQSPSVDKANEICRALGIRITLGAPDAPLPTVKSPSVSQNSTGMVPVRDRRLAKILALFTHEWEACGERGRASLAARFAAYFPELNGGDVHRVVGWLGWRPIGGRTRLEGDNE